MAPFCASLRIMELPAIVLPLFYCPPVSWFVAMSDAPTVYLEQHEHYLKGSYRNRCHIAAVNGVQRLTVPLRKGKNQQQPIREVRIAYDEPWQIQHWRAICTAYGNSPFFEHYAELFEPCFRDKQHELLWDWNYDLLLICNKILKLNHQILFTEKYEAYYVGALDLRKDLSPNYRAQNNGSQLIKYPQVFEDRLGFLSNLSVLDIIFCAGKIHI